MEYEDYTIDELKKEIASCYDKDEKEIVKLSLWLLQNEKDIPDKPDNILSKEELRKIVWSGSRINLLNTLIGIFKDEKEEALISLGREYERAQKEDKKIWDDLLFSQGLETDENWKVIPSKGEIVKCDGEKEEPDEEMIHYG